MRPLAPPKPVPTTTSSRYLAQCTRGLEGVLATEVRQLGASSVEEVPGGVLFEASRRQAHRSVLWLRSAVRVLEPVISGPVEGQDDLYDLVYQAPWEELVGTRSTLAVRAALSGSTFTDTRYVSLKVKDAVVDRIRARKGVRPNVDRDDPDVPLRVVIRKGEAHVFRDLAGESLHRRGHRPVQVKSPLAESTAAGLLLLSDWDRESPLLDPMCGSGTFLIEAASLAMGRAPGFRRRFASETFPDTDGAMWIEFREEADDLVRRDLKLELTGADRHHGALGIARQTARMASLERKIRFVAMELDRHHPKVAPSVVVTNPPWGDRIGEGDDLVASWHSLGGFLRRCPGASAFILCAEAELTRNLGLRASRRWPVRVGPKEARWLRYEMRSDRSS